ncbi:MAG: efflux RND transporter periplasmic adaptor subunit [Caulobacter sp.]|nr:efflux RND transporter periplasmic adaptor subunit [Caulobacter sp.]
MKGTLWLAAIAVLLAACDKPAPPPPEIRTVRTVTVQPLHVGEPVSLTGHIRAQNETSLAFRIDGRLIERRVDVGANVTQGQVVARLDPQNEENALRSAEAALSAAQALQHQTKAAFERQQQLLTDGWTTRAQYDLAEQALKSAEAQVASTTAQLHTARDRLGYAELVTDVAGSVTATGAEAGEVVRTGQMIIRVAPDGKRDAVFDVPAQLIRNAPKNPRVEIALTDDPKIKTTGHVREVAPQADPVTQTYQVKVELDQVPAGMRLGATVTGRAILAAVSTIELPASALTGDQGKPAVWLVDPASETVSMHPIEVLRFEPTAVLVSGGLTEGNVVVTAGVHALRPGQKVRMLEDKP